MENCAGAMASSAELCKNSSEGVSTAAFILQPNACEICFRSAAYADGDLARAAEAITESIRAL